MLAALASAILIVGGSLLAGQAALSLCGRAWTWLAGPVGLGLLLAVSAVAASLDARGTGIAVCLGVLLALGAVVVARASPTRAGPLVPPVAGALAAALFAALPFIAAGAIGVLGVGLVNDDMSSHLLIADWIDERFRPEPVFIDQGYPLGPHALVAGLSTLLHANSIDVFAGFVLAIPMLTALVAFEALGGLRPWPRAMCAVVVALPYMAAAYLAQEAFKEPILALFLLAFALLLGRAKGVRDAVPLGVLAAGTVYVYSFPGVAWLAGTVVAWAAIELVRGRRLDRGALVGAGVGVVALLVLIAPELPRLLDFKDFRALDPDKANEGGLGNLREQVSPLTALGIWPTSEFRLPAGAGSLPAAAFYAGALIGVVAFVLALPRWVRRHGAAIPAALLAAVGLYLFARAWGTVYTSAKAISILAPLITLVILGGLLVARTRALTALAAVVALATAFSSFLILRQAPVAPEAHMEELAEIRPLVNGEKLLFLGRDNFILYELRGSRPFTHLRNFYGCRDCFAEPNPDIQGAGSKFDFDVIDAKTLAEFPYVLTTKAGYASGPPPGYEIVKETANYALWERGGGAEVLGRRAAEAGPEPGAPLSCEQPDRVTGATFPLEPFTVPASEWSATTIEGGDDPAVIDFDLPQGDWLVSLRYDSTGPVTLDIATPTRNTIELEELPGNLDYRGPAPFWPAGKVLTDAKTKARISATVEDLPLAGRLLGAHSTAHLGELALSPASGSVEAEGEALCAAYADWLDQGAG